MTTHPFIDPAIFIQETVGGAEGLMLAPETGPPAYFDGGYIMYPLTFCALMALFLSVRAAWRLWGPGGAGADRGQAARGATRLQVDGILFWGACAVVVGVLGTVVGFVVAAQSIEYAGEVNVRLVFGGLQVALIPTIYGLLYFLGAALIWFGLRFVHRKRMLESVAA